MISLPQGSSKDLNAANGELAEALQAAVAATLNDTFGIATSMEAWRLERGALSLDPFITCTVDMKDAETPCGIFIIAFSYETIVKVLNTYGVADTKDVEVINDAAEEIANMVYGTLKTALNKRGSRFCMEIPHAVREKQLLSTRYQNDTKMILPFLADGHRCKVMLLPMKEYS